MMKLDNGHEFALGNKPRWVDFYVLGQLEFLNNMITPGSAAIGDFDKRIGNYCDRVLALPQIQRWVKERPEGSL